LEGRRGVETAEPGERKRGLACASTWVRRDGPGEEGGEREERRAASGGAGGELKRSCSNSDMSTVFLRQMIGEWWMRWIWIVERRSLAVDAS
jgi:hypothetical protein